MRRLGICGKGSGIDKVISYNEIYQLRLRNSYSKKHIESNCIL
jgi:hypothetical protein